MIKKLDFSNDAKAERSTMQRGCYLATLIFTSFRWIDGAQYCGRCWQILTLGCFSAVDEDKAEEKLCGECGGSGEVDSGGMSPWGDWIMIPCPHCGGESKDFTDAMQKALRETLPGTKT